MIEIVLEVTETMLKVNVIMLKVTETMLKMIGVMRFFVMFLIRFVLRTGGAIYFKFALQTGEFAFMPSQCEDIPEANQIMSK